MSRGDPLLLLPWMCAALVLSIEAYMKGLGMAFIVGASGLSMFGFILAALVVYKSLDGPERAKTPGDNRLDILLRLHEARRHAISRISPVNPVRLEIAADVSLLFFKR